MNMCPFIETKEQLEAKLAMLRAEMKSEIANMKKCDKHDDISSVIAFYDGRDVLDNKRI